MWALSGRVPGEAVRIYASCENRGDLSIQHIFRLHDPWALHEGEPIITEFPVEVLGTFPLITPEGPKEALDFFKRRKIRREVVFRLGVRFFDGTNFVAFPLTDVFGNIKVIRLRSIYDKECFTVNGKVVGKKELLFPLIKHVGSWFGLHLVDWRRPVMLVEGEIDAMRLITLGLKNVVASTGWHIKEAQANQICAPQVIVGLDADTAGIKGAYRADRLFNKKASVTFADWSTIDCKDPGELRGKKSLAKVLGGLKQTPAELQEVNRDG